MIRRAIAASTAVLFMAFVLPQTANAQSVYVLAGLSAPTGDFGDAADTGWLAAGGVTFPVGQAGLWAGGEGLYSRNGIADLDDESFKLFSFMGVLGYDIPTESSVSPFVFGGAGLMGLSQSFLDESETESGFGWQLGGGVAFEGESNISPFIEARYQSASINDVTVSFLGVEAGVSIGLGD